jgi:hypothetical protein
MGSGMNILKERFDFLRSTKYGLWRHIKGNQINVFFFNFEVFRTVHSRRYILYK